MELKVDNMTCGGCVNSVRRILSKQLVVDESEVEVSLDSGSATIPDVAPDVLQNALEKLSGAGFDARPV